MDASALFDNPPLDDALRSHKDLEPSQFQFHRLPLEIAELVLEEYAMSASVGEAARSRRVNRKLLHGSCIMATSDRHRNL